MSLSLGAALYYELDLSTGPTPLRGLWDALTRDLPASGLVQWTGTVSRVGKKQAFDLVELEAAVATGNAATAAIENDGGLLVLSHAAAAADLRAPLVPRPWRYDTAIAISSDDLAKIGSQRAVDAIVAFADAVAVQAGILYWTDSVVYASALAVGGVGGGLTSEQERHVRDSHDLSNHWGRIIRGPAWGTFLNAAQVAILGDLMELHPARVVPLRSGGAYVQLTVVGEATSIDEPSPPLDRLRAALAPVLR
jgi:hypothetical protein